MSEEPIKVGVDTGGTFTDVIKRGVDGGLEIHKLLSTPSEPSRAIGDGIDALSKSGEAVQEVIHGTTVATNALLERRGAAVAFVTTAGFEDLLWMRRQAREELYDLEVRVPPPLVERGMCFGVRERIGADGRVIEPLEDEEIERVVEEVSATAAQAVVICLLHSYAFGEHEEKLAEAFRRTDEEWHVTASREVTATFREYERGSTTTINGYVGPVMGRYLERLSKRLDEVERLEVLQSHGGRADAEQAARLPVHTVLSGPAGGVVGALQAASELGIDKMISFDMGGTSTDVSLASGEPTLTQEGSIGGFPLQVPIVDIYTVGAGGGSMAYVDAGGALRVGPRSAGADPGPVAYGRGGEVPTVTDAHVVLGSLRADRFLGGRMVLAEEAARKAVGALGEELGMDVDETARGILDVADAAMTRALKVISLERGHDPRDYGLVAFGGAGGLHACRLAQALDMKTVVVPRYPGLLSAVGMLRSPTLRLYSQTLLLALSKALGEKNGEVRGAMEMLEQRARREMGSNRVELSWTAFLRYEGQSYSIPLEVDWRADEESWSNPSYRFEAEHQRLYGYCAAGRSVELVDLRLEARGEEVPWRVSADEEKVENGRHRAKIDVGDGRQEVTVVERASLAEGDSLKGPAVITEYSGTTLVLSGWTVKVKRGHLLIERGLR